MKTAKITLYPLIRTTKGLPEVDNWFYFHQSFLARISDNEFLIIFFQKKKTGEWTFQLLDGVCQLLSAIRQITITWRKIKMLGCSDGCLKGGYYRYTLLSS